MFEHVTELELLDMAQRAGREVARQYPGIEAEDIASEAVKRVYERADRLAEQEPGYLYEVLRREGLRYAAQERYQFIIESSQYVYTPREVKALLEHCYYEASAWDVPTGKDDWLSAEIDGHSIGVSLMDISVAIEKIKPEHKVILERKYFHGEEVHRQTLSRAIDSLVQALNRRVNRNPDEHEGPGARTAIPNVQAQRKTSYDMSKDGRHEVDALEEYHDIRSATAAARSFQDPPGTHFDWDKYR